MKKIKFYCNIGFPSATQEDVFEFDDTCTEEDIQYELWQWAEQFLEAWTEEEEVDDDE